MTFLNNWLKIDKRIAITILAIIFLPLIANNFVERPLPAHLRGNLTAHGRIVSCDFGSLSKGNNKFFVGITLSNPHTPYLRANPEHRKRSFYESICATNAEVNVAYKAKNRFIGSIRFWVISITEAGAV